MEEDQASHEFPDCWGNQAIIAASLLNTLRPGTILVSMENISGQQSTRVKLYIYMLLFRFWRGVVRLRPRIPGQKYSWNYLHIPFIYYIVGVLQYREQNNIIELG